MPKIGLKFRSLEQYLKRESIGPHGSASTSLRGIKNGDAPGPLGDLVKSLLGLCFSHLRHLNRICKTRHFKISKNYRFFNQKEHLPAQNLSFA